MKSFSQFVGEGTGDRGKDWFATPKSTGDAFVSRFAKRKGKPRTAAIPNDTGMAPHSPRKATILSRI
jgi:hypothetical protein